MLARTGQAVALASLKLLEIKKSSTNQRFDQNTELTNLPFKQKKKLTSTVTSQLGGNFEQFKLRAWIYNHLPISMILNLSLRVLVTLLVLSIG